MLGFGAASPAPGGTGPAVDQTARNAAATAESIATAAVAAAAAAQTAAEEAAGIGDAAQIAAEAAQAAADSAAAALSGSAHDSTARASASAAAAAAATADGKAVAAQAALSGSAHDSTARAAAAAAQAGSGNDSTARAAAVAAQADADALDTLIALRASKKRVCNSVVQTLTTASTIYKVVFDALAYATGAFVGSEAEVGRITIPAGVSKIRVQYGTVTGTTTTGTRNVYARRYSSGGTLLRDNIGEMRMVSPGTSAHVSMNGLSGVIDVAPGDYIEFYATSSTAGTTVATSASSPPDGTYLEVQVIG